MAGQDHAVGVNRIRKIKSWFDEHNTTILTVGLCALAVGMVAFSASQIFAAREVDDAQLAQVLHVRDDVEGLDSLYTEADADFLRLLDNPSSHAVPWNVTRIERARHYFGELEDAFVNDPQRSRDVEALRRTTSEWQRELAQTELTARTDNETVSIQRQALGTINETRHRLAVGVESLDPARELSTSARASISARRLASERVAFAAAAAAAFALLVYGFLTNHRLALERARVRIAAEEGEARFREYFEEHPLPMLIYDVGTRKVTAVNEAAVRLYGYSRDEFEGLAIARLRPADEAAEFLARFTELAAKTGMVKGSSGVRRHMRKDGTHFFVEPTYHFLNHANRRACFVVAVDVTEKELAKEALQQSKQMLEAVIDSVPQRIFWKDTRSQYLGCNRAFADDVGLTDASKIAGLTDYDLPWHSFASTARMRDSEVIASGKPLLGYEEYAPAQGGAWRWFRKTKVPLKNARDDVIGLLATYEDITERKDAELALRLRSRALDAIVNAVLITRATKNGNLIEYANPAFERITGYRIDDVIGSDCRFLQGDDRDQPGIDAIRRALAQERDVTTLVRNYRRDGTLFWNQLYIAPVRDEHGQVTHHISVVNDVTELMQSHEMLHHQANFDSLTGLPNRALLNERLDQAIRLGAELGTRVSLIFMDVDHFKDVNDSLGHGIGDRLLRNIAQRLGACAGDADTVARYGGDEFVLVIAEEAHTDRLTEVLARVSQAFARPIWIDGTQFYVEASIGIASFPSDGCDGETLLRRADLAMYRSKSNGRNSVHRYEPELGRAADERLALSRRMRVALANGEFRLDYQPQVDLLTNRVTGVEALLRWRDAELGPVSPATFIPIAEENGLIVPIGEWVMQQACFQAQAWQSTLPGLRMSVNISPRQFARADILRVMECALTRAGLPPSLLEVEITEGALMAYGSIEMLRAIRATGVDIAIDDFGTGYSSLSYIRTFHADRLKLDMSFVRGIGEHREDEVITRAILSLGRALGFKVVAEGVETDNQLAFLRRHGCNFVQGYRFARPMVAADAHAFILNFNEGAVEYS
ncbi:EAL domain-containing protein [Trinickia terrae]|uniref:EAL domain-containing protein n=1 Tax=Trinickia terrae TaxID=2571161 RepID=A0A4U1I527_9BURK|nr:EAL domain-containing protein [Trinickia terrae]TKC88392.1 EAL domain-containing protein [Trinickia terrae]